MPIQGRRKKFLLYLVSIVFPSLLLVVFTLRLVSQDRELARKRITEDRQIFAQETGRALLSVLDKARIRAGELGNKSDNHPSGLPADPLIALICELRGMEIRLPWDDSPESGRTRDMRHETTFLSNLDLIEKAEFRENDAAKAARLGQSMLKPDLAGEQAAVIRFLLARSLYKSGRSKEAEEIDRSLLSLPASFQDEFQIPLGLYVAERLAKSNSARMAILAALDPASYPWRRLSPEAVIHGRDIFIELEKPTDPSIRNPASRFSTILLDLSKKQEQAEKLKSGLSALGISAEPAEQGREGESAWRLFGQIPWFVSETDFSGGHRMVLARDARFALKKALDIVGRPGAGIEEVTIGGLQDPNGLSLGRAFPNAHLILPSNVQIRSLDPSNSRTTVYLLMMGLAVGLAILGSVFFWRDVRRDLETAELRSLFVASVSHELKTPLAAIRMFAETLRLKRFREPEKETEYLDTIVNESQRLDRLIANVLDFSKIEKSRRIYRFENTSIKDVLESAVRVMDYPLRSKGFQLKLGVRDELPEISADADALLQAVLNLLDNAMKYSGDSREIELSLIRDELNAIIRIRDWGIGIPASEHQRIFEKFQRVPDRKSEGVVGAGLGLALAEHIVEAHGGRIEVESRPGEGSVFSLILPLENRV